MVGFYQSGMHSHPAESRPQLRGPGSIYCRPHRTARCTYLHSLAPLQAGEGQHSIGYINDAIALHAVRVPEHCTGTGAVTLHLYSPPIRRVRLYEPDNDRIVQRVPGFFTVGLGRARREQEQQMQQAAEGAAAGGAGAQVGHAAEALPLLYEI